MVLLPLGAGTRLCCLLCLCLSTGNPGDVDETEAIAAVEIE